jgi:hypothetical protein
MGGEEEEKVFGEFKTGWKLPCELPYAIHELYKDGCALTPWLVRNITIVEY